MTKKKHDDEPVKVLGPGARGEVTIEDLENLPSDGHVETGLPEMPEDREGKPSDIREDH